jgi:hypothetical protein
LVQLSRDSRELGLFHVGGVLRAKSASERILEYLRLLVGEEIEGEELAVVSGISEYARRVREWRVEFGWPIIHRGDRYKLERDQPDQAKAQLWNTLNSIRRSKVSARDKMLAVFRSLPLNTPVTTAQLRYVTEGKDMRRVRELRTEFGWRIMTKKTGVPILRPNEYVLVDAEPVEEHDRHIPDEVLVAVLTRDKHRCRKCNWHPNDRVVGDPRQYVEIHHIEMHSKGGSNEPDNLVTLCNMDHRNAHRLKLNPPALRQWLAT